MDILMMWILPIHTQSICFHLFVSSLVSLKKETLKSVVWFSEYKFYTSLVRFIPRYFIFPVAISNGIFFSGFCFWYFIVGIQKCLQFLNIDFVSCCLHTDQWNKIGGPEINPSLYGQLKFNKGGRSIKWSKNSLFNKWCWEIWTATCKKLKLSHQLTSYTKINSKWIKDLNFRPETIKIVEENVGSKILDTVPSNFLSDIISPGKGNKRKNKQVELHQTKTILPSKGNHRQSKKTTHRMGEHIHQYIW